MDYGVDVGMRRLAVACPETGVVKAYKLPVSDDRATELHQLQTWAQVAIPPGSRVWVEAQFQQPGLGTTAIKLAMTSAVVLASAAASGGMGTLVPPSTWKMVVCGNGGLDKVGVAAWLATNHPALSAACDGDQDQIDACCIGLYGQDCSAGLVAPRKLPRRRPRKVLRSKLEGVDEPGRGSAGKSRLRLVPGPA
jgi:hypothetical protein